METKNLKVFLVRYKKQLKEIQVDGICIDENYLWKQFCKLNKVPKKPFKWTGQHIYDMNTMTDDDLYRNIVKVSGSIIQEMR